MKKTAAARRRRKLFSQEYWDEQPKIHLTYSALMEFRHREGTIRWGNGRDETPALETSCKTVEDFAKRGGPDLTHLCDVGSLSFIVNQIHHKLIFSSSINIESIETAVLTSPNSVCPLFMTRI